MELFAANLLDDDPRRLSDRILAYALYIDPPLGRVGRTEDQVSQSGRAVERGETQGFMKILVDAETQEILGTAGHKGGCTASQGLSSRNYA